jgi:para-nitrobenzyl esterase
VCERVSRDAQDLVVVARNGQGRDTLAGTDSSFAATELLEPVSRIRKMPQMITSLLCVAAAIAQAEIPSSNSSSNKPRVARITTPELRIDSGFIRGLAVGDKNEVRAFKGIPYAAPPLGARRWKAPQPVSPWPGVRDCFEFGAACPQTIPALLAAVPEMAIGAPASEDCLFLNVWTPAERKAEKLPVLYWIHGGGFVMGAASQPLYDGEELARLGCVVVSVNYRLGLFGFLAHPTLSQESDEQVSGNYGLLDQVEGLRWVKRNIAAFGGDPDRVTIFGESAGGISVLCLMVSPPAKGLFQRAVAQSATAMDLRRLRDASAGNETAEQAGQKYMAACGLADARDAAKMRGIEAKALVQATPSELGPSGGLQLKPLSLPLGPNADGFVIPDMPNALFAAGRQNLVPLIIGNTKNETSLFLMAAKMPEDEAAYAKQLEQEFGKLGEALAKGYPARDAKQIRSAIIQLTSDLSFASLTRTIARMHSAAGQQTYRYQFSRGTKRSFLQSLGAHHGAELALLFQRPAVRDDDDEVRMSHVMGQYWINFAATGNPNGGDLPEWPAYRQDTEEMVDFAEAVNVLKGYRNDQLDLIDKVLHATAP